MKFPEYFELIEKRMGGYFDFERDYLFKDITIDLKAISNIRNEKYFAFKEATIYAYENNEIILFKSTKFFSEEMFINLSKMVKENIGDLINISDDHMSSLVNFVIISDGVIDKTLADKIMKYKFHKSFSFGFKGWVDLRFTIVSLFDGIVYNNKKTSRQAKFLLPL